MKNAALISALITEVSNRKKHDKGSVGYLIGMMDGHSSYYGIYWNEVPRERLIAEFIRLINTDKINRIKNAGSLKAIFDAHKVDYSKPIAKSEFKAHLVMEYSATPIPTQLGEADNTMEFYLHNEEENTGCIIWDYEIDGEMDEEVIGLWFENSALTDYDGVFELPKEAIALIESAGYNADYAK